MTPNTLLTVMLAIGLTVLLVTVSYAVLGAMFL